MSKNLLTVGLIALVLALLVGLNIVFLSEPRREESEQDGDRSSYRGTPYGTLAYYLMLSESGREVVRFERPYTELADSELSTLLVVVPREEHRPTEEEVRALEAWVQEGGTLVLFDRAVFLEFEDFTVRTREAAGGEARPAVPSMLTRGVRDVRVTGYATTLEETSGEAVEHVVAPDGPLVIDRPLGDGHLVVVSEPYVVQNNGIREGDNLSLALNLAEVFGGPGTIAFDEYHHGYGAALGGSSGGLRGYVAGTPVPWILLQLAIVAAAVAFTVGRRFGRPVPIATERRTSALEFVGSMASIQMLAKASDLAVENIYTNFRARLCRYAGVPSGAPAETLARAAAARGRATERELLDVLRRCEAALSGSPPKESELLALVARLRELERRMKL